MASVQVGVSTKQPVAQPGAVTVRGCATEAVLDRWIVLMWILLSGALLAASKVATRSSTRELLLLAAVVCVVMMFVSAY